ncbi:hypothetical protein Tco_0549185 [Tanacetum coccineum]
MCPLAGSYQGAKQYNGDMVEARPALRIGSPVIRRANGRTVQFEGISDRAPNGTVRTAEEKRGEVSNGRSGNGGNVEVNLPPLLAAHLGRTKAEVLLQPSMASGYVVNMPSINQ